MYTGSPVPPRNCSKPYGIGRSRCSPSFDSHPIRCGRASVRNRRTGTPGTGHRSDPRSSYASNASRVVRVRPLRATKASSDSGSPSDARAGDSGRAFDLRRPSAMPRRRWPPGLRSESSAPWMIASSTRSASHEPVASGQSANCPMKHPAAYSGSLRLPSVVWPIIFSAMRSAPAHEASARVCFVAMVSSLSCRRPATRRKGSAS